MDLVGVRVLLDAARIATETWRDQEGMVENGDLKRSLKDQHLCIVVFCRSLS